MKSKAYVPKETSIYMRYLFQDKGLRGNELLKRFPKYSKATIYRHTTQPIDEVTSFDKRKHNKGRPRKLSIREERNIMRHLRICRTTVRSFSASRLRAMASIILMYLRGVFEEPLIDTAIGIYTRERKDL